ncbi:unnamed protein product, partial [Mesorhabditis spiculigera]
MRPFLLLATFFLAGYALPIAPVDEKSPVCLACENVIRILQKDLGDKILEECIADVIIAVCTIFKIEDHFICKNMVGAFVDETMWIAQQILVTPTQICGLLLGNDCDPVFNPFNQTWTLDMPPGKPPVVQPQAPKPGMPTLKVLHLSDIHLDMYYTPGLEADCPEPQCCRPQQSPDEIVAAGVTTPTPIKVPAGYWGTVGNCDAPYWLFTSMLQHAASAHQDLDYILVSGDLMSHTDWVYTRETHAGMIRNISDTIRSFFPKIPTFFTVGNHEGVPIDNFAPWDVAPIQYNMSWLYDTMAESYKGWVPQDQMEMVKFNGCYMKKLYPGLRLISLNNGLGDSMNFWLYVNETDPDGTMTWFINQLADAERAGDRVHIVAHIPSGSSESLEGWSANYYNAINRFESTVVAQFMGHTHSEEFQVMYSDMNDPKSRPTGVIYSTPSITPYSEYYPTYRVYTLDGSYNGSTWQVLDWEEWRMDLLKANADPPNAKWEQFYPSAAKAYGLKDFWPASWDDFITRMKTDDALFQRYRTNFYRRENLAPCDAGCKRGFLCSARTAHHTNTMCDDLYAEAPAAVSEKKTQFVMPDEAEIRSAWKNTKKQNAAQCL